MKATPELAFTTRPQSNVPMMLAMLAIAALSVAVATLSIVLHTQAIDRGLTSGDRGCSTKCSPAPLGFPGINYCTAMVNYYLAHGFHETDHVPADLRGPNFSVESICVESTASVNMSSIVTKGEQVPVEQLEKQFPVIGALTAIGHLTQTIIDSADDNSGGDFSSPVSILPDDDWASFVGWSHYRTNPVTYEMAAAIAGVGAIYEFQIEFDFGGHYENMPGQVFLLKNIKIVKLSADVGYGHTLVVKASFDQPINAASQFNPQTGEYEADGDYDWNGQLVVAAIRLHLSFHAQSYYSIVDHNCEVLILGTGEIVAEACDPSDAE